MPYKDKEKERKWRRKYRLGRKCKGVCRDCNQPVAVNSNQYCLFHVGKHLRYDRERYIVNAKVRERKKAYQRARYYRFKSDNKCTRCGMPLNDEGLMGGSLCLNCYDKRFRTN